MWGRQYQRRPRMQAGAAPDGAPDSG